MTTSLDTRLIPKVKALIAKYGKTVVFRRVTGASIDPLEGTATAGTTTDYPVKVTPPAAPQGSRSSYAHQVDDGQLTRSGSTEILAAANNADGLSFEPVIGMVVVIDGREWVLDAFDPLYTGDLIAAYRMLLGHG